MMVSSKKRGREPQKKAQEAKVFDVGCSIIVKGRELLIAQRKPGDFFGGYWEFPGGKRRSNETLEECLKREVFEELGIAIFPRELIKTAFGEYLGKKVNLYFYLCDWVYGRPYKRDCYDFRWVFPGELRRFLFLPPDVDMINEIMKWRKVFFKNGMGMTRKSDFMSFLDEGDDGGFCRAGYSG